MAVMLNETHDPAGTSWLATANADDTPFPVQNLPFGVRHLYLTIFQMIAHHTINGCNMRPGDLIATGTVSGPTPQELGSLLELTANGSRSFTLPGGETRTFLEDGDEVILRAQCRREGYRTIGFGEARGTITPARGA